MQRIPWRDMIKLYSHPSFKKYQAVKLSPGGSFAPLRSPSTLYVRRRICMVSYMQGTVNAWHSIRMAQYTHGTVYTWHSIRMVPYTHGAVYAWHRICMVPYMHGAVYAWHCICMEQAKVVRNRHREVSFGIPTTCGSNF